MKTVLTDQEPVLELMPVRGAGEITLGEWLEDWLEYVIRPNREDTTYYGYQSIVRNHAIPAMGRVPLAQLDPMRIQAYYSWLRMEKGLSANTVHKHHILLHTALKTAFRQGLLEENPVDRVEAPRQAPPRQSYYDSAQLRALLRAARGHRLELVIRLAASLGLRRSEICGLRWENVDLEGEIIYVRDVLTTAGGSVVAKQPKTPHSIRKLGVAGLKDLQALLRKERMRQMECAMSQEDWVDSGYVIVRGNGAHTSPNQVSYDFHRFLEKKGLPLVTLHGLRHTFASLANSAHVPLLDIGKALGHKDCAITGKVYTHIFDQTHQEVISSVAACISGRKGRRAVLKT